MSPATPLDPLRLRPHYARFLRPGRVLLSGHSHQAWPDSAREGVLAAWDDAAEHVDDKWERASAIADEVRATVAGRIGARADEVALAESTHTLVVRFLSALDLRARPHLVTTNGEFHSLHRQLGRLAEAGVEITSVPAAPVSTLSERIAAAVRDDTAAILASSVLFETSAIVPGLDHAARAARRVGAETLIDAYHAFSCVPFSVDELGGDVWVIGGGYKYAQFGEGVCFLRAPPSASALRPIVTGWFADFGALATSRDGASRVTYGARLADRFAGATYDPTSHYRAAWVARFWAAEGMSVSRVRAGYVAQTERLVAGLADHLELASPRAPADRGGFVAFRHARAGELVASLRARGVSSDARGELLRLGPAPYVTDDELDAAIAHLRELTR